MIEQEAQMIQAIERLSTIVKIHDKELDGHVLELRRFSTRIMDLEKKDIEQEFEIRDIYKEIKEVKSKQEHSGAMYFWRKNWWKIGSFILAFSTIFGALGEYLYRLPPPK